jgi:hypothetical protein
MHASLSRTELEVWLEIRDPDELVGISLWDHEVWDGTNPGMWADPAGSLVNVICDLRGFVIERGRQTVWDELMAASCELELDNSDGRYSVYGSEAWPRIRPGFALQVVALWRGYRWPLFVGSVSEYTEGQTPGDYKVSIKAIDGLRSLADPIGVEYNPGNPEQPTADRIHQLLDRAGYDGMRNIAMGSATMTNYLTSRTVLDEIKVTAMSDGGIVFMDNDGTFMFMGQERIFGRVRPPGAALPSFTDGCGGGLPYAAVEPILADHEFGNVITVSNVSQGTDSPQAAVAVDDNSVLENGRYMWSPTQLVICNVGYLQDLADFQLSRRSTAFYRINSFEAYPAHDDGIWDALLPMRVGDSLFVTRTPPKSQTIHAPMICDGLRMEATPNAWKFTVRCSPGDSIEIVNFWDFAVWDTDRWV